MPNVPAAELGRRHEEVRRRMGELDPAPDALLVVEKADLYYLSGTVQQCHFVLSTGGVARLLVRKVLERAREDTAVEDVRPLKSLRELPRHLRETCGPPPWRIGMELDVLPVTSWLHYRKVFGDDAELVDASPVLLGARSRKSDWEIERFREAAEVHARLFAELPGFLSRDLSTHALQKLLDARACELGHCGIIRMRGLDVSCPIGLVVSGEEGAIPSHSMFPIGGAGPHPWVAAGGSFRPIERDTPIILDYLSSTSGYHADCTRMAVKGSFPAGAAEIFEKIRGLLRSCEGRLVPGTAPSRIYEDVVAEAREMGLGDGFMGPEGYQVRFIGHGVGLQVNELPVLAPGFDDPLVPGNVVAVEPKYTHPRWGVIGLENTYAITEDGAENLTPVPEDVISDAARDRREG